MNQLVNRRNKAIRLIGIEGAHYTDAGKYVFFRLPDGNCIWSAKEWELTDYEPYVRKGESKAFRDWLKAAIAKRGYSAQGLSLSMGFCHAWLTRIIGGKMRLREKYWKDLERELGLKEGEIARKLKSLH